MIAHNTIRFIGCIIMISSNYFGRSKYVIKIFDILTNIKKKKKYIESL